MRIIIDPGHGLYYKDNSFIYQRPMLYDKVEDLETVKLAKILINKLDTYNVEVYWTRNIYKDDLGTSGSPRYAECAWLYLSDNDLIKDMYRSDINIRWHYANDIAADLFISLHFNACGNHLQQGSQVIVNTKNPRTMDFAKYYYASMASNMPDEYKVTNTILDGMDKYAWITYTDMDAIIVEGLYIDNINDNMLMTAENYNVIAEAIIDGIIGVYNI